MSKKSNISLKEIGFKLKTINTDPKTGSVESEVVYLPDFAQVFEDLQNAKYGLYDIITNNKMDDILKAKISKDTKLNQLYQDLHNIFNKYRTHIRTQYPSEYEAMKHSNVSENFEAGAGEQYMGKKFIAKKNMKLHELKKLIREEILNELFVGPRDYKTYRKDKWTLDLIEALYYQYYGLDIEEEGYAHKEDINRLLNYYGATHHQGRDVLKNMIGLLVKGGYEII